MKNLYKSLTIKERIDAIKCHPTGYFQYNQIALSYWRNDMSIVSESNFVRMLEKNKFDAKEFQTVINYKPNNEIINLYNEYCKKMDWYKEFTSILNSRSNLEIKDTELIFILRNFIFYGYEKILRKSYSLKNITVLDKVLIKMSNEIGIKLIEQSIKTLITEVNIMREKELLKSETSSDRFKEFILHFRNSDKIINFFDEYIVLARILTETTIRISDFICELMDNIDKDIFLLHNKEDLNKKYIISDVDFNLGDSHSLNKTVVIFTLNNRKIVYKPKNLGSFNAFSKIVSFINKKHPKNTLIMPEVIDKGSYAYVEYIEYKECENKKLSEFYKKFGYQLALMYIFNCTDIHMENLIARREYPVIIDLETILQTPNYFQEKGDSFINKIIENHFNTITRTAMLQTNLEIGNNKTVEIGALFGDETEIDDVLTLIDYGYDTIRLESKKIKMKASNNIPKKEGFNDLQFYMKDIIYGYKEYYNIILSELNDRDFKKIIYELFEFDTRVIYRNTSVYDNILKNSYHPDFMKDMLDREKAFENLWENYMLTSEIIDAEIKFLKNEDIPLFIVNPLNNIVKETDRIIGRLNVTTGKEYFLNRIESLGEKDLNLQCSLLQLDFENKFYASNVSKNNYTKEIVKDIISVDHKTYINKVDIECELKEFIKYIKNNINFTNDRFYMMGVEYNENAKSTYGIIDNSFYDGVCGIIYFLRNYSEKFADLETLKLTNKMVHQIVNDLSDAHLDKNDDLGLNGICGIIHLFSHCNLDLLPGEDLNKCIKTVCDKLRNKNIDSYLKDYLNGIPSALIALCVLFEKTDDPELLYIISIMTDELLRYLKVGDFSNLKELGYAHSIRSILFSLTKSYEIIKKDEIIDYVNMNIFDLSDTISRSKSLRWCNGLVGTFIVNKYLLDSNLLTYDSTGILKNENDLIDEIIMNSFMMDNDCVCHGNSGIIEYFIVRDELENALKIADYILFEKKENKKFKIRETNTIKNLSLYTGVTGIYMEVMNTFFGNKNLLLGGFSK